MKRIVGIVAVGALVAALVWLALPGRSTGSAAFLGYVEGESLLIAPKRPGRLVELSVAEGDRVDADQPLFALDADDERAAVAEATARLEQARARLADTREARRRPAEIEVLEARRRKAEAALDLSRTELERLRKLRARDAATQAELDRAQAAFKRDQSALAEVARNIEAARLPGRDAQINAAEAEVEAGRAVLERARIALAERKVSAPQHGRVLDVLYRPGETVAAGQPVVELLPPENLLARFYVPEAGIAGLAQGQRVTIGCDGCPPDLAGRITYIAGEAEFTPPVIFSRQERAKLVFLVEARPTSAAPSLKPGLPVEVRPQ